MNRPDESDQAWLAGIDGQLGPVDLDAPEPPFDEHDGPPDPDQPDDPPEPQDPDQRDDPPDPDPLDPPTPHPAESPPRFDKAVAVGFAATVAVVTIGVSATLLAMRTGPATAQLPSESTTHVTAVAAAIPSADTPAPGQDAPIPYTASASCPPGSTAAQSMSGVDPTRAFICVRSHVDGQVITLDMGRSMVITAISITPGWVGKDTSGQDQWNQHRVVSKVQYVFDDTATTIVTQQTGNVHGEAVIAVPRGVLASKITLIVLQTTRAPATQTSTVEPPPGPGPVSDILGAPAQVPTPDPPQITSQVGDPQPDDPADHTFAISSLKILGHAPE